MPPYIVLHSHISDGEIEAETGDFDLKYSVTESSNRTHVSKFLLLS